MNSKLNPSTEFIIENKKNNDSFSTLGQYEHPFVSKIMRNKN